MPYYVFNVKQPTEIIKQLDFLKAFEVYKEARNYAREQRAEYAEDPSMNGVTVKMVHASSQLEAEERLQEHREKPILREWEK